MLKSNDGNRRLFTPTLVIIMIAVLVLVLAALGAYFYYFSSPGKYWHAKGQKSGAEATKKAEFNLNEAMRIVSENYAYSLVEQPLLDTTGNALSKAVVKKEEVVVFGEAKTFDWSFGLQFRQIHLIDQTTFRPTGQGGWVTSVSLFYFTSPKEAWEWGHRERKERLLSPTSTAVSQATTTDTTVVYDVSQGVKTVAMVPKGAKVTLEARIISNDGKVVWDQNDPTDQLPYYATTLRGINATPTGGKLPRSDKYYRSDLPIAALLLKMPGWPRFEFWDGEKHTFTTNREGKIEVVINDDYTDPQNNVGLIEIKAHIISY